MVTLLHRPAHLLLLGLGCSLVVGCAAAGRGDSPYFTYDLGQVDGATADRPRDLAVADQRRGDLAAPLDLASAGDFAAAEDLAAEPDLAAPAADLAMVLDLAAAPDQAVPADLATSVDQAVPEDLAVAVDQARPRDLAVKVDLATRPDLTRPPDLATRPDLAGGCQPVTMPCDVYCQNCGVNLKCTINQNRPLCIADGNVPPLQACGQQGIDNCQKGSLCIFQSSKLPLNLCRGFCKVDADCKNGSRCALTLSGGMYKVCSDPVTNCDAAKNAGCPGAGCFVVTPSGLTGCHAPGAGGQNALCATDYDCKGGYGCLGGLCLRLCRTVADCPNAILFTCYGVQGWPANLGVCDF